MRTVEEMKAFLQCYENISTGSELTQLILSRIASELLPNEHIVWVWINDKHGFACSQYRFFVQYGKADTGYRETVLDIYDIKDIESIDITKGDFLHGSTVKISMTGMEPKAYKFGLDNNESRITEDVNYVIAHSKLHGGQEDLEALEVHFGIPQIKEYNNQRKEYINKILEPLLRNAICYSGKSQMFLYACLRELYPDEDVYLVLFVECLGKGHFKDLSNNLTCIISTGRRLIFCGNRKQNFKEILFNDTSYETYSVNYSEIVKIGNKLATYGNPAHVIIITAGGDIHLYPGKKCVFDLVNKLSSVVEQAKYNPVALKPIVKTSDISFPVFDATGASTSASNATMAEAPAAGKPVEETPVVSAPVETVSTTSIPAEATPVATPSALDTPAPAPTPTPQSTVPVDELRKYKELLDEGIITQEEFDIKKKQLLNL